MDAECEPDGRPPDRSRSVIPEARRGEAGWHATLRVFVPLSGELDGAREERMLVSDRAYPTEEEAVEAARATVRQIARADGRE